MKLDKGDVGTVHPELSGVLAIPSEPHQGVVAAEVGQLHFVSENATRASVDIAHLVSSGIHASNKAYSKIGIII